jgi:hypothetical protein
MWQTRAAYIPNYLSRREINVAIAGAASTSTDFSTDSLSSQYAATDRYETDKRLERICYGI